VFFRFSTQIGNYVLRTMLTGLECRPHDRTAFIALRVGHGIMMGLQGHIRGSSFKALNVRARLAFPHVN
jgi:hypothetical protein